MSQKTGIEWCDSTWNPVRGCSRVSEGCRHCYAESVALRFSGPGQPYEGLARVVNGKPGWTGEVRLVPEHLTDPLRWRRPRRIFANSMSDLFHGALPDSAIDQVVAVMIVQALHETKGGHTIQTLTKRAARMLAYFTDPKTQARVAVAAGKLMDDGDGWHDVIAFRKEGLAHPLLWWGVSVENQDAADERIPLLLKTPAAVRFISAEPLLSGLLLDNGESSWLSCDGRKAEPDADCCESHSAHGGHFRGIDWVIAGCESGHGARPAQVDWYRSLRDQCAAAGTSFFLKQARTREPVRGVALGEDGIAGGDGSHYKAGGIIGAPYLDGRQHLEFPEVSR